jgi:hypothetical protein
VANDKKFIVKNGLCTQNIELYSPDSANTVIMSMSNGSNVLSFGGTVNFNAITQGGCAVGAGLDAQKNFTVVEACSLTSTGCHNTFIGQGAGRFMTFGEHNFFAGQCAGMCNIAGACNINIGRFSGLFSTGGRNNINVGYGTGAYATILIWDSLQD